ncbi:Chloroperoxidase [Phaeosphaeriaceae sp. PMI808]|nr:Chloroperoxidase [Phaeosphaeriaceae sp. PMI808]
MRTNKILVITATFVNYIQSYRFLPEYYDLLRQKSLIRANDGFGQNDPFIPTPDHLLPYKKPFNIDEEKNYYERFVNGSVEGYVRRSSCPAVNILANRGYINRSGRNVSYTELSHAVRKLWNFGDDNIMLVLAPTFALHGWPDTIDLDMFNDDKVQFAVNCPAAPTRNDRQVAENININMTLYETLISYSSDGETLSLEDMAEFHHLRHNMSKAENPFFTFGNQGAICSFAQYTNMMGILGRYGKHGRTTLYLDDVETFYLKEDVPKGYMRREEPYYSMESNALIDRMTHHIGFTIQRPFPDDDLSLGKDVEPEVAKFERDKCPSTERERIEL